MKDGESANVFPLMFRFTDLVQGRGFIAEVCTEGRGTMMLEDGEWWMAGVNPGGVIASGATEKEALAEFRKSYAMVLQDSASLAATFAEFQNDIEAIFSSTSAELIEEWTSAALAIRAGGDPGVFAELERKPCDATAFSIDVRRLIAEQSQPQKGPGDRFCVPLAAAA